MMRLYFLEVTNNKQKFTRIKMRKLKCCIFHGWVLNAAEVLHPHKHCLDRLRLKGCS